MNDRTLARRAGSALGLASVLAIAGFTVLGSVFEYPQILEEPTGAISRSRPATSSRCSGSTSPRS
jgi:hypothetical protein